jgi:hypothetical protein
MALKTSCRTSSQQDIQGIWISLCAALGMGVFVHVCICVCVHA